jgi:P27 family predicted phage terminase small subunit
MPRNLRGEAAKLWKTVVPLLEAAGILSALDGPVLVTTCEAWALYRAAADAALKDPRCTQARRSYESYHKLFLASASKCGLTIADRQRLQVKLPQPPDELEEFLRSAP